MSFLRETIIDTASSGDTTLAAADANQSNRLYQLVVIAAGTTTVTLKDGSTALTGAMSLAAGVPLVLPETGSPWASSQAGSALVINNSTTVQISGRAYYRVG